MDRGVYVAASGAIGHNIELEAITSNIAGSNVAGFKKDVPVFSLAIAGTDASMVSVPGQVYTQVADIITDFSQGIMNATGNPLDAAISGDGFFVVETPQGRRYTRNGSFAVDSSGQLQMRSGYAVEGEGGVITLTPGEITIADDGTISVNGNEVDRLKIVVFPKPYPLQKAGEGLFALKGNAAELPAEGASVIQGRIEMSNINVVHEMVAMISAIRAYESHMKLIKGFDDITEAAIRTAA